MQLQQIRRELQQFLAGRGTRKPADGLPVIGRACPKERAAQRSLATARSCSVHMSPQGSCMHLTASKLGRLQGTCCQRLSLPLLCRDRGLGKFFWHASRRFLGRSFGEPLNLVLAILKNGQLLGLRSRVQTFESYPSKHHCERSKAGEELRRSSQSRRWNPRAR